MTFFWNGNRSGKLDDNLETYYEVPSDRVPFNQLPKMKAKEIGDAGRDALVSGKYDYVRLNFANGDMVGHTGVFPAVLEACEAVDLGIKVRGASCQAVTASGTPCCSQGGGVAELARAMPRRTWWCQVR